MSEVSDHQLNEEMKAYQYVIDCSLPKLSASDTWYSRQKPTKTQKNDWHFPFLTKELVEHKSIKFLTEYDPFSASKIGLKKIREIIRNKRKANEPYKDELVALYGLCVLSDFVEDLDIVRLGLRNIADHIDKNQLQSLNINYASIGYNGISSLAKTDIKWLIENYGEPKFHENLTDFFYEVNRDAINRFCWSDLAKQNQHRASPLSMKEWMQWWFGFNLGMHNNWKERAEKKSEEVKNISRSLDSSFAATNGHYVIADLETTGLNSKVNEIIEFAAILVDPQGKVVEEFSTLVKPVNPLPEEISGLTGITQMELISSGIDSFQALNRFLSFVKDYPIFFHNAPFDISFINAACEKHSLSFNNSIHDTLSISRRTWRNLESYRLSTLAELVGAPKPTHRGLADAQATLAVLLAARKIHRPN
jgi:DNA polymerase III epsilon subunit-like protein